MGELLEGQIVERIYKLRLWWIREYEEYIKNFSHQDKFKPNIVYMGHNEWYLLCKANRNVRYGAGFTGDYQNPEVFGMKIKRVTDENYLAVGRVKHEILGEGGE